MKQAFFITTFFFLFSVAYQSSTMNLKGMLEEEKLSNQPLIEKYKKELSQLSFIAQQKYDDPVLAIKKFDDKNILSYDKNKMLLFLL